MVTTLDIDLYDPQQYAAGVPFEKFRRLRHEAPVYHHHDPEQPNGFWAITRHADVVHVSRNPEIFSSYERTALIHEFEEDRAFQHRLLMLNQDPPQHTSTRSLVNRGFTPRMIAKLEERVGKVCERIVGEAVAQGEGNFVTLCAAELPLVVIAELMGVPQEDRHRVFDWSNRMVGGDDPDLSTSPEDAMLASMEMMAYANELAEQKRQQLQDDIISTLISPDEAGNLLTELEFDMFFLLLAVAGNETTRNAISGGMQAFIEHPDQWERLKSDLSLLPTAADEIVRWVTPVMHFRRTAMADTEIGGHPIKKGDKVVVYYISANRDETVFDDPDTFDIGRDPNAQIGFGGGGPHFCLGRHLAKLELEMMFKSLAQKVDRVELTGPVRRLQSNFLNGIKEMPVRFVPAAS